MQKHLQPSPAHGVPLRPGPSRKAAAPVDARPAAVPLWPLPLIAGLLPAIGAFLALALYTEADRSWCNPFIEDCVSISRMAKHGLANSLFRALVLPGAVLQVLTWLVAALAFVTAGLARRQALALASIGVCAGVTLVVYGSFLGTDGEVYQGLRRWGTLIYFGGTYLTMLLFARAAGRLQQARRLDLPHGHRTTLLALLAFVAVITLLHAFASVGPFARLEDRIENLTEWWGSLALTLIFVTMASSWRHWGLDVTIGRHGPTTMYACS